MWSGGGLSLKDQERKKWKGLSKSYVVQDEPAPPGIYEVEEDTGVDEDDEDQGQLEDIASAMLENPEDESLLIACQDAKKDVGKDKSFPGVLSSPDQRWTKGLG